MKKTINLLAISLFVILVGCSSGNGSYYDDEYYDVESSQVQSEVPANAETNTSATVEDKYLMPEESSGNEDLSRSDYSEISAGAAAYNAGEIEYRDTTEIPIVDDKYYDEEGNEVELENYYAPLEGESIGSGYRRYFEYYYPTIVTVDYIDPYYYDPYWYSPGWSFSIGFGGYYGGFGWGISWGWGYYPPYYGYYPPYYGYYPPYYGYYPPYYCDPYYYDPYYGYGYTPSETRYRNNYNGDLRDNRGGRSGSNDLTRTTADRSREVDLTGLSVAERGGTVGRSGGSTVDASGKGRSSEIDRTYAATSKNRDLELASLKAERREAVARGTDVRGSSGATKTKRGGNTVQSTKGSRGEVKGVSSKGSGRSGYDGRSILVAGKSNSGEVSSVGRTPKTGSANRVPKDYRKVTSTSTRKSGKTSYSRNSVESYYSKNKISSSRTKSTPKYKTGTYKRSSTGLSGSSRKTTRSSSSLSSSRKSGSSTSISSSRSGSSSRKSGYRSGSSRSSSKSKSYSAPSRRSSKSYSSPSRSGSSKSSSYRSGSSSRSRSSSYGSRSSSHGSRSSGTRSSGSRGSSGGRRR